MSYLRCCRGVFFVCLLPYSGCFLCSRCWYLEATVLQDSNTIGVNSELSEPEVLHWPAAQTRINTRQHLRSISHCDAGASCSGTRRRFACKSLFERWIRALSMFDKCGKVFYSNFNVSVCKRRVGVWVPVRRGRAGLSHVTPDSLLRGGCDWSRDAVARLPKWPHLLSVKWGIKWFLSGKLLLISYYC